MDDLIPMLETDDLDQTIQWYGDTLGFTVRGTFPETGDLTWVSLKKDKVVIMFTTRFESSEKLNCSLTGSLYFYPKDVQSLWKRLQSKNLKIEWPLEDFHYGMREFAILDNNGYRLVFGQTIEETD